ncbi:MAG: hypothetical protein QOD74_387 [Variibacter sp.]|jgi:hypothetical protein|nr:hypothetical protein [Variibacter sp.]
MGRALLIITLFGLLAGAIWILFVGWNLESGVEMSAHGYIAMVLGIVLSLAVGGGLMALVFYSHRHGYDEPPHRQ